MNGARRSTAAIARFVAMAIAALALSARPLVARADEAVDAAHHQEAGARFRKGLAFFDEGDYQAALIEFRRAYKLAPNYKLLYNIGQVYFQLQDYPGALDSLEQYLEQAGANVPPARRDEVAHDIEKLKARVAYIDLATSVSGADVSIDDVTMGTTPLPKPIMVSAGRHKITIAKAGFTAATRIVDVASGDAPRVVLDPIEPKPAAIPEVHLPAPPPIVPVRPIEPLAPPPALRPSVPLAGIVVTGGLAASAVVTGVLALNASSALADERRSATTTRDALDHARTKTLALALATDLLMGATAISGGVTIYLALRTPSLHGDATKSHARASDLRVSVGAGALNVSGRF